MIEKEFERLYLKFRTNYCRNLFAGMRGADDNLSAIESYCAEAIFLLDRPTIREFAEFVNISLPNATYRLNKLLDKGYIRKVQSPKDRREYLLEVTDKFLDFYGANEAFNADLMKGIKESFDEKDVAVLENMIKRIVDEILNEKGQNNGD
jgi:DNA-binding MarR family transcriptional regulator